MLLKSLTGKAKRWTIKGFHMRTKVRVDHKTWWARKRSKKVIESVKMSVKGKIELKKRKRLIFKWSDRKSLTAAITGRGLHPSILLSTVTLSQ